MTDVAIYQPSEVAVANNAADLDGWIAVVQDVSRLADAICGTDFVPKAYRDNAPAAMAAILTGRELGLPPMTALRHVQLVEGSASLSAEYKRARVLSAGHEFDVLEIDNEHCKVSGRRRGSTKPALVLEYTMADARRANLIKDRGGWQRRPRRMLFARAGTELCDFLFADVTNGLPTTELLAEDSDGVSGYDEQAAEAAKPTGRVTAAEIISSRQAAPQTASPAAQQPPAAAAPTPPAQPAGEAPMPPLPGEDEAQAEAPGAESRAGGSTEPDDTDYDSPRTATTPQITAIWTILSTVFKFGSDEKDQARAVCAHIIGHELASTKDMSKNEARTVLDTLGNWREVAEKNKTAPREFLIELMATAEQGAGDE
jgi:hypothetical protein